MGEVCLEERHFTLLQSLNSSLAKNVVEDGRVYKVPSSSLWAGVLEFSHRDLLRPGPDINGAPQFVFFMRRVEAHDNEQCVVVHVDDADESRGVDDCLVVESDSALKTECSGVTAHTISDKLTTQACARDLSSVTTCSTRSPILIRGSSVESVKETDSEHCYSDLSCDKLEGALPGIWSIHKPHPLETDRTPQQQSRHSDSDLPPRTSNLVSAPRQGSSAAVSGCVPPVEIDLTQDEGIVVDESVSEDDVTVVGGRSTVKGRGPKASTNQVPVVKCCGIVLYQVDIDTLLPLQWLNDQVINAYMKLLMKSFNPSAGDAKKSKVKVHITSTFFYTKLRSSGYRGVEQWMKNVDMRRLWLLLVPVHLGCHWTLAAVNLRNKSIAYYDSMGSRSIMCLKRLKSFLVRCGLEKKLRTIRHWRLYYPQDIPLQSNGSDCGVFVCQYARWLCSTRLKGLPSCSIIPFSQKHMTQFRSMMIEELKNGQLNSL